MVKYSGDWLFDRLKTRIKRCIRVTYTYISKVDSPPTIIILAVAVAQRVTYACTHMCYLGGFISALACGIFPRDERTMSVAKRKTRATLGRKYMGKPTGMRFRGETMRRKGLNLQILQNCSFREFKFPPDMTFVEFGMGPLLPTKVDEDPTMAATTKRKEEERALEIKMIRFRYQLDSFAPTDEPAKNVTQSAFLLTEVATMLGLHASPGVNVGLYDSPR
ncbi:hypothetical protein G5I_05472 [Acromyrmex echinatior]|uniref:Uncharacterized protein n=1 Tax=Acromyrmex echinatior TaxID=103372 RepID=F4WIE9_ACREC|nr:hypothetical protein G5I_05472 [Acromyrmex echinatior]